MTLVDDIRKTVTDTTPVYAFVGATDLAVEKVRDAQARATRVRPELELKSLQAKAEQLPTAAMTFGLGAAGKAEETYGELAARGKQLVDRIKRQRATQDLLAQGKVTLSRGKAAVTTARKAADETVVAAKSTLTVGKRESREAVADTRAAAKSTATTASKRAAATKTTAKAATTSARKTATAASRATEAAASKIGD